MPAEQRIIGGGLLLAGIAIVLILLYLFSWGGMSPQEAHDKLLDELYPAFVEAEAQGDYLAMKRRSREMLDVLEKGGRAAIVKLLQADASTGDKHAKRLRERIVANRLEKHAEGLFAYRDGWYVETDHRALTRFDAALEGLKTLERIRDTAHAARKAIDEARLGSGFPLELPPARFVPRDAAPIVDPNPVYASDAELFRVFGIKASDLERALATPEPGGGKARSARLRWNRDIAPGDLGGAVGSIPEWGEQLRRIAADIELCAGKLERSREAKAELTRLLAQAATMLGQGLDEPHHSAFVSHRSRFEDGHAIVTVLKHEAEMLAPYLSTLRDLGKALAKPFASS